MEHIVEGTTNNPKISVIVPIYNAEAYLERCIKSLQTQTYHNIEIILIDDGSTDGSPHICRQFTDIDKRISYYRQENSGVAAARNKGLDIAGGEYIGFCDADDWVEPDMYETLIGILHSADSEISICSFCDDSAERGTEKINDDNIHIYTAREAIIEINRGVLFAGHLCNKLFKRSIISDIRLPGNITIYEDLAFLCEVLTHTGRVSFINAPKYHYVQLDTSALHSYRESYWSVQMACRLIYDCINANFPDEINWACKTVLLGNLSLAMRTAEANKLSRANYTRIKYEINKHASDLVVSYLPNWYQKIFRVFQKGWLAFSVYIFLRKVRIQICSKNNR